MNFVGVIKRVFSKPDFVAAALVLGIAAVGMNFAINYLALHFRKEPVDMRCSLDGPDGIPSNLGKWVLVSTDKPLDPDTEHVLGTAKYIQRRYVNSDIVGADVIGHLMGLEGQERDRQLGELMSRHPEAVIDMGIFYYTGMVDTVAHIPERCYIADGFDIKNSEIQHDQTVGTLPDGSPRKIDFSFLSFEDSSGRNRMPTNVAYLFHVDGHYDSSSLGVRNSLASLTERYGYYAKVELKTLGTNGDVSTVENEQQALASMKDFLAALLPEVERIMPDWKALHAPGGK
jgi:uncharacterized protein DUF3485